MYSDVKDLRDFYARPLGLVVRRMIGTRVRARWRSVKGEVVIGIGFATPYLGVFRGEAAVLGALMPVAQGALTWPTGGPFQTVAVDEDQLPLPDASVDKMMAVHCLESAEAIRLLLREIWRVLRPEGRLLIVVPNRRGPWARFDSTPFGHGRPYSRSQLEPLLESTMFTPLHWTSALHLPPVENRLLIRNAATLERAGGRLWPAFAGVIMVEARKELVSPIARAERASVRELRPFRTASASHLSAEAARSPDGVVRPASGRRDPTRQITSWDCE